MEKKLRTEIEKEFKYELTKGDYFKINTYLEQAGFKKMEAIEQVNYYIDTEDFRLREFGTALRVRHYIKQGEFELTVKVKKNRFIGEENLKVKEELNLDISEVQADEILNKGMIKEYINAFYEKAPVLRNKDIADMLKVRGSLKTNRQNYYINKDTFISLDESSYFGKVDYELELETDNIEKDKAFLDSLFRELGIKTFSNTKSKVKRFMMEIKKLDNNKR